MSQDPTPWSPSADDLAALDAHLFDGIEAPPQFTPDLGPAEPPFQPWPATPPPPRVSAAPGWAATAPPKSPPTRGAQAGLSTVGLALAVLGVVGVGLAGYQVFASIELSLSDPLGRAGLWFSGFVVAAVALLGAVVIAIVLFATKAHRISATLILLAALVVAPITAAIAVPLGVNTLGDKAAEKANSAAQTVQEVLQDHDIDIPGWLDVVIDLLT